MTDFGAEIAVDGVRPTYVRDGDWVSVCFVGMWQTTDFILPSQWGFITAIRLAADHPQYLVAQHPGMVMHLGDARPVDFDAGKRVLMSDGCTYSGSVVLPLDWRAVALPACSIIGYHPLPASPNVEQSEAGIPVTDDVPEWAFIRGSELRYAGGLLDQNSYEVFARYIAAHETPPVDEAQELFNRLWEAPDTKGIQILRAHLAKVRDTASQSLTASNIAPNGRTASPRGQDG